MRSYARTAALLVVVASCPWIATAEESVTAPLASRSLLLDAAHAGARLVAVGERGHVLVSDDDGASWRQVLVPTRATLTAVHFADDRRGWAVGHDAVIIGTTDGGDSWRRVHYAPDEERPLLDLWFRDAEHGVAVGAYGYYLVTEDGGEHWNAKDVLPDQEDVDEFYGGGIDYHLNQIRHAVGERLFIAAEAGTVLRSADTGATWELLPSPYGGSFFGTLSVGESSVLLYGLRGHLFRTDDDGESWQEIQTGTVAMLNDAIRLRDGSVVVVGLGGTILTSRDGGRSFTLTGRPDRMGISAALEAKDGSLVLFGDSGALRAESTGN